MAEMRVLNGSAIMMQIEDWNSELAPESNVVLRVIPHGLICSRLSCDGS